MDTPYILKTIWKPFFSDDSQEDFSIRISLFVFVCVLALISFTNILTFIAVYKKSYLRTTTNVLIVNLGLADLQVGISTFIFAMLPNVQIFEDTPIPCLGSIIWCTLAMACSLYTITAIAFERYFAIVRPFIYQRYAGPKLTAIVCVSVWIYASLFPTILWFYNKWYPAMYCIGDMVFPISFSLAYIDSQK